MNYGIDIDDTISKTADKFIEYGREFASLTWNHQS